MFLTEATRCSFCESRSDSRRFQRENQTCCNTGSLFSRIDIVVFRVNVKLPTVEVKYKNLNVEAEYEVVQGKPLPTLWNSFSSFLSVSMLPS